jgi:hypothetical protein
MPAAQPNMTTMTSTGGVKRASRRRPEAKAATIELVPI